MSNPLLEARGVVIESNGRRLIDIERLDLHAGTRTIVLGPNGAGKSLLLRLLHGLTQPTSGQVRSHGVAIDRESLRKQGLVFQKPVLLRRSAEANLHFALRIAGLRGDGLRERSNIWLERAGLRELARQPARLLSGGEQQRLALARVLALEPEILLLDEPTGSLDPASVPALEAMINDAHSSGTKVVLVTHDLGQARRMADEVIFLFEGRVETRGFAPDFFHQPNSQRVKTFLDGGVVL